MKSNASMYCIQVQKEHATSSSCVMQVSITIQQLENQEWCCSSVSFRPSSEVLNFVKACEIKHWLGTDELTAYSLNRYTNTIKYIKIQSCAD